MASPDVSDIGVRLSAEGEAQFFALLKRVRAEMELTAKSSGKDFGVFNTILGKTRTALAGLGLAASVTSFVAFARAGADSADALEENAAAAGTSVSRFSALSAVFQLNGVNAEALRNSLGRLANKIQDLRDGNETVARSFRSLGLSARDFEGKDTAQALDLVARAITSIEDPIKRGAAAIDILGKSGPRAIPGLQALARQGLGGVEDSARKMGLLLDNETVAAAGRVSDELQTMQQQATALAINLTAGLSPAFHDTFSVMSTELAGAQSDWKVAGTVIGDVLKALFLALALITDGIVILFFDMVEVIQGASKIITLALSGQFQQIPRIWQGVLDEIGARTEAFAQRNANRLAALTGSLRDVVSGGSSTAPKPPAAGGAGGPEDKTEFARRLAAQRSFLDAERRLLELNLKARSDRERFRFEEGLTDLATYYARRRQILEEGLAEEIKALEARRATESQNPDRPAAQAAVAGIDAEIALRKRQAEVDQVALTQEQLAAHRKLQSEILGFEEKLAAAQGRRHEADRAAIQAEVNAFQTALANQGDLSEGEQDRRLRQFQAALEASAEFDRRLGEFQDELDALAGDRAAVEQKVVSAQISEIEGARTILDLERDRIPQLEKIAALALEAARGTGDPARIRQAEELATAIGALGISATEADRRVKNLGKEVGDLFGSSLTDALTAGGDAFDSFGQRALSVLASVAAGIQRLAAQLIASGIVQLLLGTAASAAGGGGSKGKIEGSFLFAEGGLIRGAGTGTSDSNLIAASDHEYVVQAKRVRQAGGLPFLEAFNAGLIRPLEILRHRNRPPGFRDGGLVGGSPPSISMSELTRALTPVHIRPLSIHVPRFAEGGLIGAGGPGPAGAPGRVTVGLEDGLVARSLSTRQGTRALIEVISANRESVGAALGIRRP